MAAMIRVRNPIVAAIQRRRSCPYPPLQVANGIRADKMPGPQPPDDAAADAVKAAWQPATVGQQIPMVGEQVYDDPSTFDE